jgi:acid phosphatase
VSAPSRRYRLYHRRFDPRYLEYPPSCRPGDLTVEGMDMHVALGRLYRSHYRDTLGFLPADLHPRYFTFNTSPVDRCIRSAESFLLGLYPPADPNEVVAFETATEGTSDLMVQGDNCPEISAANSAFQKGPIATQFVHDNYPIMKEAFDALNLTESYSSFSTFCGWAIAFNCSEHSVAPPWLTEPVMNVSQRMQALSQFDTYASAPRGLHGSYLLRHVLRDADRQIGNANGKKMALFSAHDTSLAACLVALGFRDVRIPFYASHVDFEYWRTEEGVLSLRVVYNGTPVVLDPFNATVVPFDDFRTFVQPFLAQCPNVESWEAYD